MDVCECELKRQKDNKVSIDEKVLLKLSKYQTRKMENQESIWKKSSSSLVSTWF